MLGLRAFSRAPSRAGSVNIPAQTGPFTTFVTTCLTNEGEVVVAAGGVGNRRPAIGRDVEGGGVGDRAAIHPDFAAEGVADPDGVAGITPAVDIAGADGAAIGGRAGHAAI